MSDTTQQGIKPWVLLLAAGILGICLAGGAIGSVAVYKWLDKTQPPNVPSPVPTVQLRDQVPAEARPKIAAFYSGLSQIVALADTIKTSGQFREAQALGATTLKQTAGLPEVPAINQPISDAIVEAIGLDDKALTEADRQALAAVLAQIAEGIR